MKFKVGDKVIIRSWDDMEKQFGTIGGCIRARCLFVGGMRQYCGKKLTIIGTTNEGNYHVKETPYIFSEDTFEKNENQKIVITIDGVETLARLYDGNKVIKSATAKCSPDDTFDFETGARLAFDRLIGEEKKPEETFKFEVGKQYQRGDLVIEITRRYKNAKIENRYDYKVVKGHDCGMNTFDEYSLLGNMLKPYDPPKCYNGEVVCVNTIYPWWTVGKVYPVVNGKIKDDRGKVYPVRDGDVYKDAEDVRHAGDNGEKRRHNSNNEFIPFVE